MKKLVACMLALALMLSGVGAMAQTADGVAQGFGGPVSVTLTLDGAAIADVAITADAETPAIGGAAIDVLKEQILAAQGAEIDGVAGATVTSNAVRAAVAQALSGEAEAKLNAGTYTATKTGYQGTVTVEVTVDETTILDVKVTEITDHPDTVVAIPCQQVPAEIVAKQSVMVDTVTGATVTSNAIMAAVADCLDQAGDSAAFMKPQEEVVLTAGEDVTVDVLVVGAGGAGILASIAAHREDFGLEPSGLKVMLVEKQAHLGGSTSVSGGGYTTFTDKNGLYDDAWLDAAVEKEAATLQSMSELPVNKAVLRNEIAIAEDTNIKLPLLGFEVENGGFVGPFVEEMDHDHWRGQGLTYFANEFFPESGIDVRTNTRAVKLLTDVAGAVTGAVVQDKTHFYNVYAKKVILACGGFAHNPELIAKYAPDYVGTIPFAAAGNTGDGIIMATEIGAATVGDSMLGYLGSDGVQGMWDEFSGTYHWVNGKTLNVSVEGERYCDEAISCNVEYYKVLQLPQDMAWGIVDSDNEGVAALENTTSKYVYKADTLEELAAQIGVPADALTATVEKYNADFDNGGDTVFGAKLETMDRVDAAPYYAYIIKPIALSSLVGLSVNENLEVLREDGSVVENLYAAGDMMFGGNYLTYYIGGRGVGTALYTGRLAGECAKDALLAE